MRARAVWSGPFRSFVVSVASTYGAGGLYALLPTIHDWLWERFPNKGGITVFDPAWAELPRTHYAHLATAVTIGAFLLAALVPWVVMFLRPRAHAVELGEREVTIGGTRIRADEVTGASVAPDGRGVSAAIGRGDRATFLELDRLEDARRLLSMLGRRFPIDGRVQHHVPRGSVVHVQAIFFVTSLLYAASLVPSLLPWTVSGGGIEQGPLLAGGAVITLLTLVLVVLRLRKPMPIAWDAKQETKPARALDRSPLERHARRHLESRLKADPEPPRVRIDLLERGERDTKAWLAHVDALKHGDAYRGDPLPKDVLFEVVADAQLAIDVRVAAARLLARRDGETAETIAKDVADDEVKTRIAAVLSEDAETAADALDAVGPLFKTG